MVVRLLSDGRVGFATFPGFGFGAGSVFVIDSFAELPTTGYVAGGSAVRFTGSTVEAVPSAALLGLDATGAVLWSNRYTFGHDGAYQASGHVGVRLTDDGGILRPRCWWILRTRSTAFSGPSRRWPRTARFLSRWTR